MPIRWSTLQVSEAMDNIEELINQAVGPLEKARSVTNEARNIPNLPQYIDQYLMRIIGEINRTIGGSQWEPEGRLKSAIESVRKALPKEALEYERKRKEIGNQLSLTD